MTEVALVPIKTSTGTGYCDCICGCYHLVSLRDEEMGKSFCPRCAEQHLERNRQIFLPKAKPPAKSVEKITQPTAPSFRWLPTGIREGK